MRGEIERGAAPGITGIPERSGPACAQRHDCRGPARFYDAEGSGVVALLRFPDDALEILFPVLWRSTGSKLATDR